MATDPPGYEVHTLCETECAIAQLWKEVLQLEEDPTTTDDFFALGGDSMTMVLLEFRIKEEFSIELPVGAVLGAPTVTKMSALVNALHDTGAKSAPEPL